uniref:Lipid-binding serum glycoprotein C-terminal domain-containing protein n=2 Tax=Parascaris univalens TaxID=6257 RepID=A0A915CD03_PARUN
MFGCHFLFVLFSLINIPCGGKVSAQYAPVKSAMRIRLSDGIFIQSSRVVDYLYGRSVMQVTIPNEQQCFIEGCVQIYALRITAQRPPTIVVVAPSPPNLITLTIADFDLYITASISGQLQLVPPIPISVPAAGSLAVVSTQMEVGAVLDVQKTNDQKGYLRLVSCYIRKGATVAKVENMGLLTNIVNLKYQAQMNEKAENVLQRTVCGNIQDIIEGEFNTRLAKVPSVVSVRDILRLFQKNETRGRRRIRAAAITYGGRKHDLVQHPYENRRGRHAPNTVRAHSVPNVHAAAVTIPAKVPVSSSHLATLPLGTTFNVEKLSSLMISLDVLDTSATYDKFFIGVNGDVFLRDATFIKNPYTRPSSLKFVSPSNGKMLELLFSEYTINTLLLKAHNITALVFRIGSHTPVFGKLLRTSCSLDEVCLSDSVPEPAEKYPNRQLEMIVRTTKPPRVRFTQETVTLYFEGRALFYLEGTTTKIGVIPFEVTVVAKIRTQNGRLYGSFSIPSFEYKNDVDFFDLTVDTLGGLRDATKGALINLINEKLKNGIPLDVNNDSPIKNTLIAIMNGAFLIQANFDLENDFYPSLSNREDSNYHWNDRT